MAWVGLAPSSSSPASDAERKRLARSDRGAWLTPNSRFLEARDSDTPPRFCIDTAPGVLARVPRTVSRDCGQHADAAGACGVLLNGNRLAELSVLGAAFGVSTGSKSQPSPVIYLLEPELPSW